MFIKPTKKQVGDKTYVNHVLVESVAIPKGPRHRTVCSLGSLAPAPAAEWLALAHKIEVALTGQPPLVRDTRVDRLVAQVQAARRGARQTAGPSDLVAVHTDQVTTEEPREAGPVHVGHQLWQRLDLDTVLARLGLSPRTRVLTELMTLNRLVCPLSEHAMPDWVRRTALADILGESCDTLVDESLYQNLNRLHPQRAAIEGALAERERTLFTLDARLFLYVLTSTYFEGLCEQNPQAQRGYSRDSRPDCKQVVVGLVLDRDGFPKAHEVFEGNRTDRTTVPDMLDALEERVGRTPGATVVVDRGMAFADNLQQITARGYHYLVASRPGERTEHLADFEAEAGWQAIVRQPSPTNPAQRKTRVVVKRKVVGDEVHILCRSDGREAKDRAIREKHEQRLLADLRKLQARVARGKLKDPTKIHEALWRLQERYPRVARYYALGYDAATASVTWVEQAEKKAVAQRLDGGYLLKTDRPDLTDEELWRTYILLTRVAAAFRAMKSPLCERPIFHWLEHRVQTHIFLCVLAYHLLVAIEKLFLEAGLHTSWATLREELSTHQVVTVVLPASNGDVLKIRKGSIPEPRHKEIYATLHIPSEVMRPVKTWVRSIVTE
ncbi:MAG TPA: IS1634 family transposase [Candidatus Methylomirabilis sp.]|nr:IS1634 family transposase [Candidatus Methylomirabilis sp.]